MPFDRSRRVSSATLDPPTLLVACAPRDVELRAQARIPTTPSTFPAPRHSPTLLHAKPSIRQIRRYIAVAREELRGRRCAPPYSQRAPPTARSRLATDAVAMATPRAPVPRRACYPICRSKRRAFRRRFQGQNGCKMKSNVKISAREF
ncbi:hypothetical protein BD626DRAFT_225860 [Schizophyllum amplum]|uniref:Uncharacterized protein n=1 Tax=Schizophyllum amplum TaxID=97359 RepID=A0A550BX11_9AGAR|nr:hypothetical protein BD626DRAFT_225860 [Auriculariopsis ampla]